MKKLLTTLLMAAATLAASAQAEIKFDKLSHDFGTFSESSPVQTATFNFTNTGDKPLVINQAVASCGCTVPKYTQKPIAPGQKGSVVVTYNGKGKWPGHFKKTVTVRTNGKVEMVRLYVEGNMTEAAKTEK